MKLKNLSEKITLNHVVLLLVFLFPLAGTFVRHWYSNIYGLFFLLAVYYLVRYRPQNLCKEEKILIGSFVAYFAVFIITSLINGWEEEQTVWLGLELRFLAIIPIYLMIRQIPEAGQTLLYGILVGVFLMFAWGVYELYFMGLENYLKHGDSEHDQRYIHGVYSRLLIGPVVMLMIGLLFPMLMMVKDNYRFASIIIVACVVGMFVVLMSEVRSAYLAFVVLAFLIPLYYLKGRARIAVLTGVIAGIIAIYSLSDAVRDRVNLASKQVESYLTEEPDVLRKQDLSAISVGTRFEMWRATQYFLRDTPIFGVGRGNYNRAMQEYIDQGLVNPVVNNHSHPHNAYIETLMSRGLLGLSVMLFLMYYPLWIFFQTRKDSPHTALLGIVHIISISIFSLTEASTFIKGNFVAINLIFLSIFFSWHMQKIGRVKI